MRKIINFDRDGFCCYSLRIGKLSIHIHKGWADLFQRAFYPYRRVRMIRYNHKCLPLSWFYYDY